MKTKIMIKFPLGFLIIFTVSFMLLILVVNNILEGSNEETITREMKALKSNSNVYMRQSFMINNLNNNEESFSEIAREIIEELRFVTESEVSAYDMKGKLLYSNGLIKQPDYEDLSNAVIGRTSYIVRSEENKTIVFFSFPVSIVENKVGILRFVKDYSSMYQQSKRISQVIFYAALAVFFIAFIFSYLLSRNISIPLLKLNRAAKNVAGGSCNVSVISRRTDEIGDLTRNFNIMVDKISDQIITIQKERDNLAEINKYKKTFFDNVTHELKTPLTSILGYAEIISENAFTDMDFFTTGINHIINESRRLHNMVVRLLELSEHSTSIEDQFRETDIGDILKNTCSGMELKAQRYGNTILCEVNENIRVYGNGDKLRQVFINIIDNAIKYGYSGSPIKVSAEEKDDFIDIKVVNRGDGIEREAIGELCTPFYRVDKYKSREAGSCGLGLSISSAIIENHGGKVEIVSEPYHETTVTVRLPKS